MAKWTDLETLELVSSVNSLGINNGIKSFRETHPDRSYNACYLKYKRVDVTTEIEEIDPNDCVEVIIAEKDHISIFQKIIMFFKRLFS